MLQYLCAVILFTIAGQTLGQQSGAKWDGLKVTWGPDPLESQYFTSLPRTSDDAEAVGFKKIDGCDGGSKWRGARYVKDGDYAVVLLYDVNGYIAGLQTGVPKGHDPTYPSKNVQPPFVDDGNHWVLTAYFVDPSTICSTGRSSSDFASQGTGTQLYIQNSTNPEASVKIPLDERVLLNETRWAGGMCFPTMGKHFWYDYRVDSNCDSLFPVFLLYNGYKLNAFGWAMGTDLHSSRFEHPSHAVLGMFMKEPPQCMYNITTLTTMHIYMTDNVVANNC